MRPSSSKHPADDLCTVITHHLGVITWRGEGGRRREEGERGEGGGREGGDRGWEGARRFLTFHHGVLLPELSYLRRHVGTSTGGDSLMKLKDLLRTS